ncbi:lytic transglycosylase domain-containing protein [Virgibacillus litoralis]|uniref:Soluble lytic murein transglycosylase-like protein n=1 Tax=Virgibacillus litoralis TaxID=578221 RepID=A0ABS4H9Y0_9BACI|nr:transglycosylase SLT domain-containing protein [Virgibacillus litoralis]MBP1947554.1 soluble lytic murein transglycosylase-like protein [Virgibacillus litoralis]
MEQQHSQLFKQFIVFLCISTVFAVISYSYIKENKQLASITNHLEAENQKLTLENDYLDTEQLLDAKKNSYHSWTYVNKQANKLVKNSNGEFKKSWAIYLVQEAESFDISPYIAYELFRVETGNTFDPNLVGPETKYGKAYGMGQIMKNTAPWIAEMSGIPYKEELLFNPYYSIHLTFVYLDFLYKQYGNWDKALTAYHRGIGGLNNYLDKNGHAKSWYALEIKNNAEDYKQFTNAN